MTSNSTDSFHSSASPALGRSSSTMSSQSNKPRRPSPGNVQTSFHAQQHAAAPVSAVSASSGATNSQHGSPIMSPEPTILTSNSSIQASPESMRPQEEEDQAPSEFQLPESIISRKTSLTSLGQSWTGSPSAPSEAVFSSYPTSTTTASTINVPATTNSSAPVVGSKNLIRRLSSRASRRLSNRRRQSSAAPSSREASVGPCLWRRRSDSNTTAASECGVVNTDSESDVDDDGISFWSAGYFDAGRDFSPPYSTTGSISSGLNTMVGPVIPLQLQQGTWLEKASKKNRSKRICLTYDPETNKMLWDRARPHKFLHVDEIREIRTGSDIQQYGRDFGISEERRKTWFSILYVVPEKSKIKFLHLIADNDETYQIWITFLDAMLRYRQEVMTSLMTFNERAIAQYWQSEMQKHNSEDQEELDIAGVMRVCQNLHIYSSQSTLQSNFRLADARRNEKLNFSEFLEFVRLMRQRQDVHRLMQTIAKRPEFGLTLEEFLAFLRDHQKEDVDADANRPAWEKTFEKFVRKHRNDDSSVEVGAEDLNVMSETAFIGFLSSRQNRPTMDEKQGFTLDRPMNEYFISSSHNTYLLGRQVAGQSSIEGYISALVRGCRCVEVDCWDGADGEPLVVHGRTLTSSISFKEVMTTINKYAFVKSKFPLWISLEVHCNPAQQSKMAKIIRESFGDRLVTKPLDPNSSQLPTPTELMERVLIKVKQPRMVKDEFASSDFLGRKRGNSLSSPLARPSNSDAATLSISQSLPQSPLLNPSNPARKFVGKGRVNTIAEGKVQESLAASHNSDSDSGSEHGSSKGSNNIVPELGELGVYCAGLKFSGFDAPAAKKFNHIFSFMESSFAKHSETKYEKMQLNIHNMRYLMRVYPDGTRLASSNFDPLMYWRRGVQMAALNWQTFDMGMQVNQAMFEGGTDSSGYVLKPQELRDIQVLPYNEAIAQGKKERSVVSFNIDVISAQQLMRPANLAANKSMDFYVDVDVFHANDKRNKKDKDCELSHEPDSPLRRHTEVIRENGFNPMFNNGQFRFKVTTKHPELVFVRWSVRLSTDGESYSNSTKDRPPMASFTAKLTNLKQGYRTLPLLNHAGEQYLFSSLFCKIDVDPIEKKFIDVPQPIQEGGSKLNRFFSRNTSPRSTVEKGSSEKLSFESN
ncbi:phosphoinositide-specific phospholipase c [Trichoderma arundinaceum]|uniref:Phosphoinositide phospholipase C n=1 Tax=Trichoderma arundinaceum TaxID=490622 RepID=A0A395NB56_TRIAR|nr:phosphoinositide-specific phospholipase c [Trichoderma arundinaceum]